MKVSEKDMLVYAVTDRAWLNGATVAQQVELAIKGGATFVQLREKHLSDEEFLTEAFEVKAVCNKYGVPFVINDNVEVALKCDADGVHVGQEDMEAKNAREVLGPNKIIGVSTHNVEEAKRAVENGADYLGAGAMFATGTKAEAAVMKKETLKAICDAVDIPVVAIGGISCSNVSELEGTGVDGVAVVSAIFSKPDITEATAELKTLCDKYFN